MRGVGRGWQQIRIWRERESRKGWRVGHMGPTCQLVGREDIHTKAILVHKEVRCSNMDQTPSYWVFKVVDFIYKRNCSGMVPLISSGRFQNHADHNSTDWINIIMSDVYDMFADRTIVCARKYQCVYMCESLCLYLVPKKCLTACIIHQHFDWSMSWHKLKYYDFSLRKS